MVRVGNPKHILSVRDLGRADVRVAMPNPAWEGVARVIEGVYRRAGGQRLEQTIMQTKVADGTTLLTKIHHRETPMWLLDGKADAGPVWLSEALYQERIHSGIVAVRIPERDNDHALYEAALVSNGEHKSAAGAFVQWLQSSSARAIYASYGFEPPR
jgi:molybdate transport system substrate-binding protein